MHIIKLYMLLDQSVKYLDFINTKVITSETLELGLVDPDFAKLVSQLDKVIIVRKSHPHISQLKFKKGKVPLVGHG